MSEECFGWLFLGTIFIAGINWIFTDYFDEEYCAPFWLPPFSYIAIVLLFLLMLGDMLLIFRKLFKRLI